MRGLLRLALCSLLVSASIVVAHDVEDDFDDEAEVEVEADDTVVVEKVIVIKYHHSHSKAISGWRTSWTLIEKLLLLEKIAALLSFYRAMILVINRNR